jgi:hypothetical protein
MQETITVSASASKSVADACVCVCVLGQTPVFLAVEQNHPGVIDKLGNAKADFSSIDRKKRSPFFFACVLGRVNCAKRLIAFDADPNLFDEHNR